jgi:hypothetical protein
MLVLPPFSSRGTGHTRADSTFSAPLGAFVARRVAGVGRRRRSRSRCDRFIPRQRRAVARHCQRENDPPCIGAGGMRLNASLPSPRRRAVDLGSALARNPPARFIPLPDRWKGLRREHHCSARRVFSSILSAGPMLPHTRRTRMKRATHARQRARCASPGSGPRAARALARMGDGFSRAGRAKRRTNLSGARRRLAAALPFSGILTRCHRLRRLRPAWCGPPSVASDSERYDSLRAESKRS